MPDKARFDLYLNLPSLGIQHAADVVIVEDKGHAERVGFRYRPDYLESEHAIAIDPRLLPLSAKEYVIECRGGVPAFVDDYLPDDWGRRVLSYAVLKKTGRPMNANSTIECLNALGGGRIGAMELVAPGERPAYAQGLHRDQLAVVEAVAHEIDTRPFQEIPPEMLELVYLANEGSGAGGARPKALVFDDAGRYLAKFNRHSDAFNVARVELACLRMAGTAGIEVYGGEVMAGFDGRDVLLLDRFDVRGENRAHLITLNGLRKDAHQRDDRGVFRYDDIHQALQKHSLNFRQDASQLLRVMLFNRAINNTDDHERNFSLINDSTGYRLSPAYDLVPSLTGGAYHAAGFRYQPYPPKPSEVGQLGKVFGLEKTIICDIADEVITAVRQWSGFAEECGVSERDHEAVGRVLTC